jgi:hypothetical protein
MNNIKNTYDLAVLFLPRQTAAVTTLVEGA